MAKQWRAAVVGTGVVGEWQVRQTAHMDASKAVALCETDSKEAQALLEQNNLSGTPIYPDVDQLLKSEKLDVVHICTPSGNHLEPALTAMNAGVNVICEKPLEIALDRIDRMIETAQKNRV